ncbi:peptidylprolyl isomerase [Marinicauda algicola]|uniref:peptidylprolyl isomerase n=1 Tax=Marinicauda algicola TaxID=2029849 RepID=A0A4S2H2U7_9PROT|nr:peptidylprolyl isomerase [Marinicauda algicola]TGY89668.1 peptidylprolyl isomerase [Marinicauda algicola]
MMRPLSRSLTALAAVLALSATACAEEAGETETATLADTEVQEPAPGPEAVPGAEAIAAASPQDWRRVDPDRLLVIATGRGPIYVELAPEFAPDHVERMKTLAGEGYYRMKVWHRVIDDFMAQGGGALDNPNEAPDKPPLEAEFTIQRGADMEITELQQRVINPDRGATRAMAGFWNGIPAGTQPIAQAAISQSGTVESWLLHCPGAAAMARTNDPNSARGQFYIVTGDASHLNAQYSVWGYTRAGMDIVQALPVGSLADDPYFEPDFIRSMTVASALPEDERLTIEVMDTSSDAFAAYLDAVAEAHGGELPDICEIEIPVRITEPTE